MTAARRGNSANAKTAALLKLAIDINESRGHISNATLAGAQRAGVTDAEIVEVVGHVALNVFTNYLNNVSETAIDFPVVALDTAA